MPSGLILVEGNSLSTIYPSSTSWAMDAAAALDYGAGMTWTTVATNGAVAATLLNRVPSNLALKSAGPTNIITVWEMSNDISVGGAAPAHAYERMAGICAVYKAAGWRVIVGTMMAREDTVAYAGTDLEALRIAVNTMIRNNYTTFADAIADIGADSILGNISFVDNLTYCIGDAVHPTDAGKSRIASIFQPVIASLAT